MIDRVADIEASGRAALPALEERPAGDWLLRVSGGETKRVNSANPITFGAHPRDIRAMAEASYAARGLPCRIRLTPLAHPDGDAALADLGYEAIDHSLTMVAPPGPHAPDPALTLLHRPAPEWLARVEPLSGRTAESAAIQARLVANIPGPIALAMLDEGAGPIAAGHASIGNGRAQLADIMVAPAVRGRGVGRRLVAGLLGWAHARGCAESMLQVLAGNKPARRLYRSLGFVDVYPYHYRVRR